MSNTRVEGEVLYLGSEELSNIVKAMCRGYRFLHENKNPTSIVIPNLVEVEGVKVVYENQTVKPTKKV